MSMFTHYNLTIRVTNFLTGGIPTEKNLVAAWLRAKMKEAKDAKRLEILNATLEMLPELADGESGWNTFKRDSEKNLVYESRCLKSAFKEAANILRPMLTKLESAAARAKAKDAKDTAEEESGSKSKSKYTALKSKLAERLFVMGEHNVLLDAAGAPIHESKARTEERAIHVMTPIGQRDALKRVDIVDSPIIKFRLRVLNDGLITKDLMDTLLEYMCSNGIGADRSQGSGQFEVLDFAQAD